jgi:hypothetical protein
MRVPFKWRGHEVLVVMDGEEPSELHIEDCLDDVFWLLDDQGYDELRRAAHKAIRKEREDAQHRELDYV